MKIHHIKNVMNQNKENIKQ